MGFLKSVEVDNYGYTAEYWRPTSFSVTFKESVGVNFQPYIDEAGRIAGRNPAPGEIKSYSFSTAEGNNPLDMNVADVDMTGVVTVEDLLIKVLHVKVKEYAIAEQAKIDDGDPNTVGDEHYAFFHDSGDLI